MFLYRDLFFNLANIKSGFPSPHGRNEPAKVLANNGPKEGQHFYKNRRAVCVFFKIIYAVKNVFAPKDLNFLHYKLTHEKHIE